LFCYDMTYSLNTYIHILIIKYLDNNTSTELAVILTGDMIRYDVNNRYSI